MKTHYKANCNLLPRPETRCKVKRPEKEQRRGTGRSMERRYISLKGDKRRALYKERGRDLLQRGVAAVLTLAGGEGTRLGIKEPKGLFEIPPGSGESLFVRQARKIEKRAPHAPWIIMVSPKTRGQTVAHIPTILSKTSLRRVYVAEQEEVPAESLEGEILRDKAGNAILSPNGNGGVFKALHGEALLVTENGQERRESMVAELAREGILYLNIVSVDNILVNILDPEILGFISENSLEVATSGVPLRKGAKMGVFLIKAGRICIREYLDEPELGSEMVKSLEGESLGNIANHTVSVRYLERANGEGLPYHRSPKKIPHAGDEAPTEPNAVKRELFIFDQFNGSESGVFQVGEDEYEGLKNREGVSESIESCTRRLAQAEESENKEDVSGLFTPISPLHR
jgi:UDP-N-acetylglucosamine pyrophosphorylase